MKNLKVDLKERSYQIHICTNNLKELNTCLKNSYTGEKALLVTNPTIFKIYKEKIAQLLQGFSYEIALVPDGEEAKSLPELDKLYTTAIRAGLDRHSAVIAFGGGVVGDVAGFLAATLYRGVPFIQIPTTLLAQVDSSVGGKVAVNHQLGKNLIGAFYQPQAVLIDTAFLATLPERELKCGLAEVIKYAMIWDKTFFEHLENNIEGILKLDNNVIEHIVYTSCSIKSEVVSKDEKEENLRAILNFGHTIGHSLENIIGYGVIKHGEAVAIGMAEALKLAHNLEMLSQDNYQRMVSLLSAYNLPTEIPENISYERIVEAALTDKKTENKLLTFILTTDIGEVIIKKGMSTEKILGLLV